MDGITLVFKHVDGAFRPSNYPTEEAIRFNKQLPLPGVPKGPRLIVGYKLDRLETELAGVFVILLVHKKVMWHYEIGKSGGVVYEMFPETPPEPRVGAKQPRVGPKRPRKTDGKPKKLKPVEK